LSVVTAGVSVQLKLVIRTVPWLEATVRVVTAVIAANVDTRTYSRRCPAWPRHSTCRKYVERKMLAWNTKYPPKNDGAAAAVEAGAPSPRTPDRPTTAADEPRPKRGMALSNNEGHADK
jgi:hypothetical protein